MLAWRDPYDTAVAHATHVCRVGSEWCSPCTAFQNRQALAHHFKPVSKGSTSGGPDRALSDVLCPVRHRHRLSATLPLADES